jgi:transcriptional regulator with XRE-family HTH domain
VPQATPKRAGRQARPGSKFPSEVLAENMRTWRNVRRLSQAQLAARMSGLGHRWTESIVGFVERGERNVTVDEYVGLEVALDIEDFGGLLDPYGIHGATARWQHVPEMDNAPAVDVGATVPIPARLANGWLRGNVQQHVAFSVAGIPTHVLHGEASFEPGPGEEWQ